MKKIFFIPCIIVSLLGTATAQNAATTGKPVEAKAQGPKTTTKTIEERAKLGVASVDKIVTLKDDQAPKLNKAFVEFYTKKDALRSKLGTMSNADYIKAADELVAKKNADIKALLTPDQAKLIDAHQAAIEKAKPSGK